MPKDKWIQNAAPKKNALHKQLGISTSKTIPTKTLNDIVGAKVGSKSHGVTVTPLLKRRAQFAKNVRK
jgi:hypothetical protein